MSRCPAALAAVLAAVLAAGLPTTPASADGPQAISAPTPSATTAGTGYGQRELQRDVDALRAIGTVGVQARLDTPGGRHLVATSGYADVRTRRPVPPNGYFRMASTTKTFLAAVVLGLSAEGRLSLDDTVERWLPGLVRGNGNDGSKITVRQLLQHTSGVPDAYPFPMTPEEYRKTRYDSFTAEQLVAWAMKLKPTFEPGKGWSYSNTNYILAGMIIEKVTGRAWHKEVDARISRPLGLSRTLWSGTSHGVPSPHAKGYLHYPQERVDVTRHFDGDASGGLISTTKDVNRFFTALLGGKVLAPGQLAQMTRTVRATGHEQVWPGARYGLGIGSRPLSCGGLYWHHGGDDLGYKTRTGVSADGRRSVVVSMSAQFADARSLKQEKAAGELIDRALCDTR